MERGAPLGDANWVETTAETLVLKSTINSHGENRKDKTVQGA